MLDSIFGFGKSKKSRHQQSNGSNNDDSPNEDNGYVFVGNDPNRSPYPQTLMLNDELIRMGSSSIVPSSSNSIYPSLDSGVKHPNPLLPYSNNGQQNLKQSACRTCSPIDNVPFSINDNGGGNNSGSLDDEDEIEILNILNRVESFVESSKYEFNLENSILRESL